MQTQTETPQNSLMMILGVVIAVVVVVGLGYFLWSRNAASGAAPAPGQTLSNPFGTQTPAASATAGQGRLRPGQYDPKLGAGPSANARIPGMPR